MLGRPGQPPNHASIPHLILVGRETAPRRERAPSRGVTSTQSQGGDQGWDELSESLH